MKTLVFCASGPKGYAWRASLRSIKALVGDYDLVVSRENPHDDKHFDILHNYRLGRTACLEGGYDAMLTVESDIIVPPDALSKLLAVVGAGVVYGLYCFRRGDHEWCLHRVGRRGPGWGPRFLGPSLSRKGEARRYWEQIVPVAGVGLGCTLIHRRVLEEVDFRLDFTRPNNLHCDYWFAWDCAVKEIEAKGHCGVVCGHIRHEEKDVIWPSPKEGGYVVRPLTDKRRA